MFFVEHRRRLCHRLRHRYTQSFSIYCIFFLSIFFSFVLSSFLFEPRMFHVSSSSIAYRPAWLKLQYSSLALPFLRSWTISDTNLCSYGVLRWRYKTIVPRRHQHHRSLFVCARARAQRLRHSQVENVTRVVWHSTIVTRSLLHKHKHSYTHTHSISDAPLSYGAVNRL